MFKYLIHIKNQRQNIMTMNKLVVLIQDVMQKYDKDKDSFKILEELVTLYQEVTSQKIFIQIPEEYNAKIYRSMSLAILDIKSDPNISAFFELDTSSS